MIRSNRWGVGFGAALIAAAGAAHGAVMLQTIARSNTSGPFGPNLGARTFLNGSQFGNTYLNNNNEAMFTGSLSGGSTTGQFLWNGGPNVNLGETTVTASPYGGTMSAFVNNFRTMSGTYFSREGTTTTLKLYVNNGSTQGFARGGGTVAAPDASGTAFTNVFFNSMTTGLYLNGANFAFASTLNGAGTNTATGTNDTEGLFIGDPTVAGSVRLALRRNDTITTNTRVGTFTGQLGVTSSMALNGAGRYALITAGTNGLQGSDITASAATGNDQAIVSNRGGSLELIAQRGQVADPSDGAKFRQFGSAGSGPAIALNSSGKVAFQSTLRDGTAPATSPFHGGVFTDHAGSSVQKIARTADLIPASSGLPQATGVAGGARWGGGFNDVLMNDAGKIVFRATGLNGTGLVLNTNDNAIFTKNTYDSAPQKFVQTGDHADGVSNALAVNYSGFSNLAMNAYGQVVFTANLSGADVKNGTTDDPVATNSALFASDASGAICLVLRRGFDINGGTSGSLINSYFYNTSSGNDGRAVGFNDRGQLLVGVNFYDGTNGLYLFSIPAPSTLPVLALAGLIAGRRRRSN